MPARVWPWLAALAAATAVAYAGSLDTPFLLDDPINITKNPDIERPLAIGRLIADPRAVVTATLRLNWLLGGFEVAGYHVLNLVAHMVAGFLVFALARLTLRLDVFGGRYARSADAVAAAAAGVFLLHPMQTESVTYVIQRAEIFAAAGLLGALAAFSSFSTCRDGFTRATAVLFVVSCVVGTYSKPSFAVVPALLLVYDACFLWQGRTADLARRGAAYAAATAASLATFALTRASGSFSASTAGFEIEGITPAGYLSAQFGVVVHYLRVALWPDRLCFDCGYRGPWPVLDGPLGDSVIVPATMLAALAALSVYVRSKQPLLPFAVFGSAVALLPTSSVVPLADFYVEHRMYLPIAFVAMAAAAGFHDATAALASRLAVAARPLALLRWGSALAVVAALGAATASRNEVLGDPVALMEDALAQAPQNERVHYNLANAYKRMGRLDEAIPHYEAAIRLLPGVVRSYQNLGSLYLEQGKEEEALRVYTAGAEAKPEAAIAHRNVGTTLLRLGRAEEALARARTALRLEPGNTNGHRLAGDALMALGRPSEAAAMWREGLAARPADANLKERLGKLEGR
ncbi:MAG: tetratricopeptide repeat protein [Candidatus Binatia bacterium]